jgi:type II secretory pathway predicted ATPase ExeA
MMLENFGLATNPFGIAPRLDFLYRSTAFEESVAHLVYGLDNSEAVVLITGAIGTGKTMAVQSFLSHLGDRYVSALVTNTNVDTKELLKLVLDDLGVPLAAGADKSDALIALKNFLIEQDRSGRRTIVVIDEAQNLSREVLEEIRLLTNIGQGDRQPVQVVLVGQPELEETVARDDLAQLRQRIRVHYVLEPLTRVEIEQYVDHRITVAGGKAGLFTGKALDRVYRISGGVPRVVNSVCGEALLTAFLAGHAKVEAGDVEEPEAPAPVVDSSTGAGAPEEIREPEHHPRREALGGQAPAYAQRRPAGAAQAGAPRRNAGGRAAAWSAAVLVVAAAAWFFLTGGLGSLVVQEPAPDASGPLQPAPEAAAAPAVAVEDESTGDDVPAGMVPDSTALPVETAQEMVERQEDAAAPQEVAIAVDVSAPGAAVVSPTYFLHVSSFRDQSRAESLAAKLARDGWAVEVAVHESRGVTWYRVHIGPFFERDEAVHEANLLQESGDISYYKVIRMGDPE